MYECVCVVTRNRSDTHANTGETTIGEYVVQAYTYQIKEEKVKEIVSLLIKDRRIFARKLMCAIY